MLLCFNFQLYLLDYNRNSFHGYSIRSQKMYFEKLQPKKSKEEPIRNVFFFFFKLGIPVFKGTGRLHMPSKKIEKQNINFSTCFQLISKKMLKQFSFSISELFLLTISESLGKFHMVFIIKFLGIVTEKALFILTESITNKGTETSGRYGLALNLTM